MTLKMFSPCLQKLLSLLTSLSAASLKNSTALEVDTSSFKAMELNTGAGLFRQPFPSHLDCFKLWMHPVNFQASKQPVENRRGKQLLKRKNNILARPKDHLVQAAEQNLPIVHNFQWQRKSSSPKGTLCASLSPRADS